MIEQGQFNTDTGALARRIQAHEQYGSNDLNEWIFGHLRLRDGLSALDLGCGTGKQSLPMARAVGTAGSVLSVDLSPDALRSLATAATDASLESRMQVLCCGLDDLEGHINGRSFDRVLSSYALYYVKDPLRLFQLIQHALHPEGIFFFCGPARDNNVELKRFHYSLRGAEVPPVIGAAVFMEDTGPELARQLFRSVKLTHFENPLRFDSPDALYSYWSSYNLYDQSLDAEFRSAAERYFHTHSFFQASKRVVGIKAAAPLV
jgi:ubiquinone/menaquinone biosynthesis C-methylase UbiE